MRSVSLVAIQPLTYQGQAIAAGEVFTASYARGIIYARKGIAALESRQIVADPITVPDPPRTKRKYKRRDLSADV